MNRLVVQGAEKTVRGIKVLDGVSVCANPEGCLGCAAPMDPEKPC